MKNDFSLTDYDATALEYPSVRLRMDSCDPNSVGDFGYPCHLLEQEDMGMMGLIRVEPQPIGDVTLLLTTR
jgi:FtsP/CotA-like multicopper oxidase with cupredoxin domain